MQTLRQFSSMNRTQRLVTGLVIVVFSNIFSCEFVSAAGDSNSLMDISADGSLLACSNRDSGTVTIVDLKSNEVISEIAVGDKPEGVAFLGDSSKLAVAVYADDKVVFIDAKSGKITATTEVFDEPYGIVSNSNGSKIFVTLEYPGQVVEIDTTKQKITRTILAGRFPRGIGITPDGTRLLVGEYYSTLVRAIDIETGDQVDSWKGASTDNLLRQITMHPKRSKAYLAHIRSKITAVHGTGSIFPYVGVVDTNAGEGRRRKRIPMDAFQGNFVVANPWETAISPDGKTLFVVFAGTDDMFVCNIVDDDYTEISPRSLIRVGHNPRAVRVSPDGQTFYVYNALDFNVVAYATSNGRKIATIPITKNPLGEEVLLGKILFYSALQPMASRRWISCASCHPDGDADGRTWHNPEGLRNTPPLFGLAWTHPQHWSADRDETQDFEHTIRGQLMQGRGLIKGRVNPSLETPNKGLSKELDALAAYTVSHKFTLSPYAKNGLSDAAKRGRELFFSKKTACATCHSGPLYSNSNPSLKPKRHDVGTGKDDAGEKMGPEYDTPTLLGIYRSAPYLHHGKAETLTDVLTTQNKGDRHGTTSHLKESEVADLVEFLKALPYEDPEPSAKKAGLTKVER